MKLTDILQIYLDQSPVFLPTYEPNENPPPDAQTSISPLIYLFEKIHPICIKTALDILQSKVSIAQEKRFKDIISVGNEPNKSITVKYWKLVFDPSPSPHSLESIFRGRENKINEKIK